jgi:hypothetical protein
MTSDMTSGEIMNPTAVVSASESKRAPWPLPATLGAALAILAVTLFGTSLWVEPNAGPPLANLIYVLVRVSVLFGLGYTLSSAHQRSAFSTLSITSLVIFVDQVPMKSWLFLHEQQLDPSNPANLTAPALVVGFIIAYALSLPIVFAFTLGGRLLHQTLQRRTLNRGRG